MQKKVERLRITLQDKEIEEEPDFRYLGSTYDAKGNNEIDVEKRFGKAILSLNSLNSPWTKSQIFKKITKNKTEMSYVLLYEAQTCVENE